MLLEKLKGHQVLPSLLYLQYTVYAPVFLSSFQGLLFSSLLLFALFFFQKKKNLSEPGEGNKSASVSLPAILKAFKSSKYEKKQHKAQHNVHLCIPAHTIPTRFHHKSPQLGCNMRSICGPHKSPNSGFGNSSIQVCRWRGKIRKEG